MPRSILLLALAAFLAQPLATVRAAQPKTLADVPDPSPDFEKAGFVVPEGFEINLWASDPMLRKPVQINFDAQGRLWVVSSTTYPHIKPGEEAKDEVVVLEDTDRDGKADKSTVFAHDLHIPTGVIAGDGGVYVANSTELIFLRDTDGDLKEDKREVILSGFGTEDTHHLLHTLRFGPEGMLYMLQSIYIHSHIETPHGVRRLLGGGVWEFRPETRKLEVISKGLINPWGFEFDHWGQSFASDGAGSEGVNFIFPGSVFATSPGAKRIVHGMSPGQPKHASQEIVDDPAFPADWQGNFIQCDFRGNRINRFSITPSGSSYVAKQEADVLASTHPAFRPISVQIGPDGALYIADWYNPIIQHGEVDFRDPRRDLVHGRIWRLSCKTTPKPEWPSIVGKPADELVKMLSSDRKFVRHFAKRELRDQGAAAVLPALDKATEAAVIDANGLPGQRVQGGPVTAEETHRRLELAWAREGLNSFSPKLWRTLWTSTDYRAKAAALRILTHRWKELPEADKVLATACSDENAQVRLWGLALAAQMQKPAALATALTVLDKPMDDSLDFLLEQIAREQADTWLPAFTAGTLKLTNPKHMVYALKATGRPDALAPLLASFKAGKLAAEDKAAVMAMASDACDAAQAKELADLVNDPAHQAGNGHWGIMEALIKAGTTRGIKPEGAQEYVTAWLASPRADIVHRATMIAGAWKVEAARDTLAKLLADAATIAPIRDGAVTGLSQLGGVKSRDTFDKLFQASADSATKALAVRGLSIVGPQLAAKRAVEYLAAAKTAAEAKPVLEAFLANKQLPGALAKELAGKTIPEPIAVEAIRMVSTRGVKGPLAEALRSAGQIKQMDKPLTPEETAALVAKVQREGSAVRGEAVYRRQALLCQSCHAIGDAGGVIGPNLVSIGSAAPVDYLIESLLNPSAKIKEGYHMVILTMKDGGITSGGLVQDGNEEVVIRDPANQLHKVAKANIASRVMSPASMMPPGLTASLRQDEFVDLVRFLSELGKEGAFKIAPNRYVRTWKTMGVMDQETIDSIRHTGLQLLNDKSKSFPWELKFSQVDGTLPMSELPVPVKMYPWFPRIAQFGLKLASDGKVKLGLSETKGVLVVVDDQELKEIKPQLELSLKAGSHRVTVLVTRENESLASYRVELLDGAATFE